MGDDLPQSVLSSTEILQAVQEAVRLRRHQIGAVEKLITGQFFTITPNSKQFSLMGQQDFVEASYVDRQIDSVNDIWTKVEIVDVPDLDSEEWQGDFGIAFFGAPDIQAMLSWDPAYEQFNTLRIWHNPQAIEAGTINDDLGIPLRILPMLLARDAALMLLPKCRRRNKEMFDAETVQIYSNLNISARSVLENEFDMWRFEEDDSGPYQSERFDAGRRATRRMPYGRA